MAKLYGLSDSRIKELIINGSLDARPKDYVLLQDLMASQWDKVVEIFDRTGDHALFEQIVRKEADQLKAVKNKALLNKVQKSGLLPVDGDDSAHDVILSTAGSEGSLSGTASSGDVISDTFADVKDLPSETIFSSMPDDGSADLVDSIFDESDEMAEPKDDVDPEDDVSAVDATLSVHDAKDAEKVAEEFYGLPTRSHLKKAYGINVPRYIHIPFVSVPALSTKKIEAFDVDKLEQINSEFYGDEYNLSPAKKFIDSMRSAKADLHNKKLSIREVAAKKFNNAVRSYSCICTFDVDIKKTDFDAIERWAKAKFEKRDPAKWEKYKSDIEKFKAVQKGVARPDVELEKDMAKFILDYETDINKAILAKDKDLKNSLDLTWDPLNGTVRNLSVGYLNAVFKYAFQPQGFVLMTMSVGGVPVIAIAGGLIIASLVAGKLIKYSLDKMKGRKKQGDMSKAFDKTHSLKRGKEADRINRANEKTMRKELEAAKTRKAEKESKKKEAKKLARDRDLDELEKIVTDRSAALDGKGLTEKLDGLKKSHTGSKTTKALMDLVADNVTYKMAAVIRYHADGKATRQQLADLDKKIEKLEKSLKPERNYHRSTYIKMAMEYGELVDRRDRMQQMYDTAKAWAMELDSVKDGKMITVDNWIKTEAKTAIDAVKRGEAPTSLYEQHEKGFGTDNARSIAQQVIEAKFKGFTFEETHKAVTELDSADGKKKRRRLGDKQVRDKAVYQATTKLADEQKERDAKLVGQMARADKTEEKDAVGEFNDAIKKIDKYELTEISTSATGKKREKKVTDPVQIASFEAKKEDEKIEAQKHLDERLDSHRKELYGKTDTMSEAVKKEKLNLDKRKSSLIDKYMAKEERKGKWKLAKDKLVDSFKRVPEFVKGAKGKIFSGKSKTSSLDTTSTPTIKAGATTKDAKKTAKGGRVK